MRHMIEADYTAPPSPVSVLIQSSKRHANELGLMLPLSLFVIIFYCRTLTRL